MLLSLKTDVIINSTVSIYRFQDLNSTQGLRGKRHLDPNIIQANKYIYYILYIILLITESEF